MLILTSKSHGLPQFCLSARQPNITMIIAIFVCSIHGNRHCESIPLSKSIGRWYSPIYLENTCVYYSRCDLFAPFTLIKTYRCGSVLVLTIQRNLAVEWHLIYFNILGCLAMHNLHCCDE